MLPSTCKYNVSVNCAQTRPAVLSLSKETKFSKYNLSYLVQKVHKTIKWKDGPEY